MRLRLRGVTVYVGPRANNIMMADAARSITVIFPSTWVFKTKDDGTKKSRVVLLGNRMPKALTAEMETSSPAPRLTTIRMVLSFAAKYDLDVELIDIKTAFLHAAQSHQIYIQLPPGWREVLFLLRGVHTLYVPSLDPKFSRLAPSV